jgi:predicted dehydrogenase
MYNIAVVGCGYWGPNLIRNFYSLPEAKVKYVCDKDKNRLSHMKELYPTVDVIDDFQAVINDTDVHGVAIATPVNTHFKLAKQALKAGKHTFLEKPMASSVAECNELIEIAKEKALALMVGHVFVHSPSVLKIKELIDSGEIGEIFYISMRRLNLGLFQKDINVAWDLAPHDISIALFLLGENPVSVNCQGKAHINPNIEDITNISLNFNSGRFATIQSSWIDPRKIREITIVGSKKMVVYDDTEPLEKIKVFDKRVSVPPHYDTFAEFQYSYHYGDISIPYIKQTEPLKVECQDFIDAIKSGKKPVVCGEKGRDVVQILEASSISLKNNGAEVKLNANK